MNPAIEQIVSSDEAARVTVERAERDAAKLIADAREEANSMLTVLDAQIRESEHRDILPILTDAQQQAQHTLDQARTVYWKAQRNAGFKEGKNYCSLYQ